MTNQLTPGDAAKYKLLYEKQVIVANNLRERLKLAKQSYEDDLKSYKKRISQLDGYQWRARRHEELLAFLYEINEPLRDLLGIRFVKYGAYDYKRTIWNRKKYRVAVILSKIYRFLDCDDE